MGAQAQASPKEVKKAKKFHGGKKTAPIVEFLFS
jgi:hypothetical protein